MPDSSPASVSSLSDRSVAVALITLSRYLADRDPDVLPYLVRSLNHAKRSSLADDDLAMLRLMIGAIER